MKLTTKQEAALLKVYTTWWHSYLNGDVKTYDSFLADDFHFVGSTNGEEYLDRKDTTAFFEATADQMAGKTELRNLRRVVETLEGGLILITDMADAYVLSDHEWMYYSRFRFSSILRNETNGWKFIYQHFSAPDAKAQEGETLGLEQITKENRELRDAIKRRTIELEQKNRELEIETALERIRARALAMHSSDELSEVANTLREQMGQLSQPELETCSVHLYHKDSETIESWYAFRTPGKSEGKYQNGTALIPFDSSVVSRKWAKMYFSDKMEYTIKIEGENLKEWLDVREKETPDATYKKGHPPKVLHSHFSKFSGGALVMVALSEPSEDSKRLQKKAAMVFDLAYKRFLDLKRAEEQAREAQIEAALERVRGRALAMHKSDELLEVIEVVAAQFHQLNLDFDTVSFAKNNPEGDFKFWFISNGQPKPVLIQVPPLDNPVQNTVKEAQKKGLSFISHVFTQEENREWVNHLIKYSDVKYFPEKIKEYILNSPGFARSGFLQNGIDLYVVNYRAVPYPEEDNAIFKRFAQVFEQSYIRFLDLQTAERQARESQIEAALERVRSKTMAMHNSQDVSATVITLFDEVIKLGIDKTIRCGIGIHKESGQMETWSAESQPDGQIDLKMGMLDMNIHPLLTGVRNASEIGEDRFTYRLEGRKAVRTYYNCLNNAPDYPFNVDLDTLPDQMINNTFFFSAGILFAFTRNPMSEEAAAVLKRFAMVFDQTYTRYLDLQKAEEQAREAIKQASLDRVRGEIASMRSTDDLQRITPLVFNELTTLGVPFIRCGVFIINEHTETVEAYLSAPDGHSLAVMKLPFRVNDVTHDTVKFWRKKETYIKHWDRDDFVLWTESLIEQGYINNKKKYIDSDTPPDSLDLHFIPFTQGMLYVGNNIPLQDDAIHLAKSLADAFAIAYARYEDFVDLEKAKESTEQALSELKATQNQLVQSEKMASLGELTAGIAHEIQNPLNFVNNFSEVSTELIEEMNEELDRGDTKEAKVLAADIKQNLQKILHHGKRADGIVKGMLQHSRSSSGVKEPTDINVLCDEYLRLAYHGLRAKDKTFNAQMKTDFDDRIGRIHVVPQEIGRVILNLITNAFYAVNEKAGTIGDKEYHPTVTLGTKKKKDVVEILVSDNGNGIPDSVREKIFQPFFTTKPTGQGTGLGLSMSYDIVTKGHGGSLEVKSEMGKGSSFSIMLPLKK